MDAQRLYIQLGSQCNCDCIFCATADSRHLPRLSLERITEHLKIGVEHGFTKLTFSGGEPTIRRDLRDIVNMARQLGYSHIQVQTNARALANRKIAEQLFNAGVNAFLPSIHGHTAESHDAMVRARGAFAQTVNGIANIVTLQHSTVNTNTVITKQNYLYLPEIGKLLIDMGVTQIQLSYVQAEGNAKNAIRDIGPVMTDAYPFIRQATDLCIEADVKVLVDGIPQCVLSGHSNFARNMKSVPRVAGVTDNNEVVLGRSPDKLKIATCTECCLNSRCGGVWQKYIEMYGWSEFMPVPQETLWA